MLKKHLLRVRWRGRLRAPRLHERRRLAAAAHGPAVRHVGRGGGRDGDGVEGANGVDRSFLRGHGLNSETI